MKKIKLILASFLFIAFIGCEEDERGTQFVDNADAPSEVNLQFTIAQDNSGLVSITPNGVGATKFNVAFGDGTGNTADLEPGQTIDNVYPEGTYTVTTIATGINGLETQVEQQLVVSFRAPENLNITAEVDASNPFQVNVSATADFAASFLVYFDTSNPDEEPTPLGVDGTVSNIYPLVGDYTIRVVALSGGNETTEGLEDVTISSPTELPIDFEAFDITVFFGFGGASGDIIANPDTNGNASATVARTVKGGPEPWAGNVIELSAPMDFSTQKIMTLDVWSPRAEGTFLMKLENLTDNGIFIEKSVTLQGNGAWEEVSIDFSDIDTSQEYQKIVWFFDFGTIGDGSTDWTFYLDNIDQTAPVNPVFDDGLLTNGDFENGSDSWLVGVDDSSSAPVVTNGGNTYYSVDVTTAGNPFDVNLSQKLEIIQGETYTLTFDAWSDVNRSIIAGIGLSSGDFSNTNETVNITPTVTNYTLTLTATGFGALDARVLFDVGAEVGMVNIDNVSLIIPTNNLLTNGDFENGSDSWIVGVDDNSPAPVVTVDGNTYYSVDVTSAGDAFAVNVSQKLEVIQDETYTLTFDAWSDVNRSIIAGIGLSGGDFSNTNETVNITPTVTTYTLTLTATGFGALDARVLFDIGAEVGMVNIDNVSLSLN
ncbi:carbohydrate binding domain-containing protein [uncultured Winogradskyella sp.]|uniref:carbohydrate binding domain-containing protein n=1 Tax=uncultured Winogradskyella sp. TaxID=395353 RepID=UPI00261685D3|nr:carbohydrate binding domain-containing protein [uncultured Winogradskyella sp.]